ncbi:Ferredoxin [Rhizobium sp. NFR07]|uniref:ferredoxin n=1 Tax=Rhizobium sp. NFR07 TaxID=1566262 RepID=UPI0008E21526|nr:ferredoxin [Rhizobium sp. NFR07]SFB38324.1 Ferredoxin [Rhizobium sp. NFR07]
MSGLFSIREAIEAALKPSGILFRGTVDFEAGEGPLLANGQRAASVMLLGNAGGSIWPAFSLWRRSHDGVHPLDRWSKEIIRPLAEEYDGTAYFPSDEPWQPFQQWAMRAEGLKPSPLGILIHPEYGLWHGYRGAIGLPYAIGSKVTAERHPCETCETRPCLAACPVGAIDIDPAKSALQDCRSHLLTQAGRDGCMISGCLARNACPVGPEYRYPPEQLQFHMESLD